VTLTEIDLFIELSATTMTRVNSELTLANTDAYWAIVEAVNSANVGKTVAQFRIDTQDNEYRERPPLDEDIHTTDYLVLWHLMNKAVRELTAAATPDGH